jgi:hypothetical protein
MTIDASMTFRHRLNARSKSVTGTHLPHPQISVRQIDTFDAMKSGGRERLSVDGITVKNWSEVFVTISPDYWQVVV